MSTCHLEKIIKLTKSSNLPRCHLRILVTISEPFDISKWGLLPIGKRTIVAMKNDPSFHWHTIFPKRNATFKKITKFALAAMEFQQFCENHGKMCTQIIEYTEELFDIFQRGLLPVTPRRISLGEDDPGSLTLGQGHHKKSGN